MKFMGLGKAAALVLWLILPLAIVFTFSGREEVGIINRVVSAIPTPLTLYDLATPYKACAFPIIATAIDSSGISSSLVVS